MKKLIAWLKKSIVNVIMFAVVVLFAIAGVYMLLIMASGAWGSPDQSVSQTIDYFK